MLLSDRLHVLQVAHRKPCKQNLRKLDIKLDAFDGLSWCAPWHHIVHDIVHVLDSNCGHEGALEQHSQLAN